MNTMILTGPNGADPLGFLSALGAFRVLSGHYPNLAMEWRPSWLPEGPQWRVHLHNAPGREAVLSCLADHLNGRSEAPEFNGLGEDIRVSPEAYRTWAPSVPDEWTACFGASVRTGDSRLVFQPTAFHMMAGGQRWFLQLRKLAKSVTPSDLEEAVFGPWRYEADVAPNGWDSTQGIPSAYRNGTSETLGHRSVRGALWLLVEALPFFPCFPNDTTGRMETTGFVRDPDGTEHFQYPLWPHALGIESVRQILQSERPADMPGFRSERLRDGYYARFCPAAPLKRSK